MSAAPGPEPVPAVRDPDRYDDAASIEAGRKLFAQPATFLLGVARLGQLPPAMVPEVAMAGRSNVGKSSLINALTGRNGLARTSNTPGRTQEINLFDLAGGRLTLVDLPGYGYAKAPKEVVERWTRAVFDYLRGRPNLMRVCLLIDARHGLKKVDEEVMDLLAKAAVPFQVVLTKADLVRGGDLSKLVRDLEGRLARTAAALPHPIVTSSRQQQGIDLLRAAIAKLARPPTDTTPP
ncbi:ribosome biogenesis GTP-binding protein YihA/YsxC [Benzoatithermus flavus]|uniref:Probable GTP-binding protein EngB n=1 Tax=Benzoatithermus flavus TaxID=3108223 RepID=A0ABU8XTU6_9PROT